MTDGTRTKLIGVWFETEPREIRQCPSSYAADWEILRTRPGAYPVYATQSGFYAWRPESGSPYWLHVSIAAERIAGSTYSGYGGLNFASRDLPLEPKPLYVQSYGYALPAYLDSGQIALIGKAAGELAPFIAEWRAMFVELAEERAERESFKASLSVYLQLREARFGHDYARSVAEEQHAEHVSEAEHAAGDRLAAVSSETMGKRDRDRIPLQRAAIAGDQETR